MPTIRLKTPAFTAGEVLEVIPGLSNGTLQAWLSRRVVEINDQAPGTGRRRLFSARDIIRLSVAFDASCLGINPGSDTTRHFMESAAERVDALVLLAECARGAEDAGRSDESFDIMAQGAGYRLVMYPDTSNPAEPHFKALHQAEEIEDVTLFVQLNIDDLIYRVLLKLGLSGLISLYA